MQDTITMSLVSLEERMAFLPKYAGAEYLLYEQAVFAQMDRSSLDYQGGLWDFYTLSNGGFFIAPDMDGTLNMQWDANYYEGTMSAIAAGTGVNLFVQSAFCYHGDPDRFVEAFHKLRDFALKHVEANEILAYID